MAELVYGETVLKFPNIEDITVDNVLDAEGRTVSHVDLSITATGWLYAGAQSTGTQSSPTSRTEKSRFLLSTILSLNQPRQAFAWTEEGETILSLSSSAYRNRVSTSNVNTGNAALSSASPSTWSALGQDVLWGPHPECRVISNFPDAIQVRFRVTAHLSPSTTVNVGAGSSRDGTERAGSDILSYNASVQYTIDQDHYTVRVTRGTIVCRASYEFDADAFRRDVYTPAILSGLLGRSAFTKGVGLPAGFVRESCNYTIPDQRNILQFELVDREVYRTPPQPATSVTAQMEVIAEGFSIATFRKILTGVVSGNKNTTKEELLTTVLRLVQRHIMTWPLVYVEEASLIDFLYENRIAFRFNAIQAPGLFFSTFKQAGIFIDPPTNNEFRVQDLRGTANLRGSAYELEADPDSLVLNPPSAFTGIAETQSQAEQDALRRYLNNKETKGSEDEPGLIVHEERVTFDFEQPKRRRIPVRQVNADGSVSDETIMVDVNGAPTLKVYVTGRKLRVGKPPNIPNPKLLWNDNDDAHARADGATEDTINFLTGYTLVYNIKPKTRLVSKLGGKDVYEVQYYYAILMHPTVVKKLKNLLDEQAPERDLEWIAWPEPADGLVKELNKILMTNKGVKEFFEKTIGA